MILRNRHSAMKKWLLLSLFALLFACLFALSASAKSTDLDRIELYEIDIRERTDATLDLTYHIRWRVLDDTTEGPLEWVKIGTANYRIDSVKNLSPDVAKSAEKYSDDGSFVRVDFKHAYFKDEVVEFSFSLHQKRIFSVNGDDVEFSFRPGYFPEIAVDLCRVRWFTDKTPVYTSGTYNAEAGCYVWERSLARNETFPTDMRYPQSAFPDIDLKKDYISNETEERIRAAIIISVIIVCIVFVVWLCTFVAAHASDGYDCYSGFSGRPTHFFFGYGYGYGFHRRQYFSGVNSAGKRITETRPTVISSGSSGSIGSSGGHSCACACACACAGGGRAGCSRKDFTHRFDSESPVKGETES